MTRERLKEIAALLEYAVCVPPVYRATRQVYEEAAAELRAFAECGCGGPDGLEE
jgi:hypothetical protein